jgi:hypothetical protein
MAHADVAIGIEHVLTAQNPVRDHQITFQPRYVVRRHISRSPSRRAIAARDLPRR